MKPGRNERCPCGSGRKYKVCCGRSPAAKPGAPASAAAIESALRQAQQLLRAGQFEAAIGPLAQVNRLVPDNAALLNDLGIACLFARRLPEAIAALRRSTTLRPAFASTHHHLGVALTQSGDHEGALAAHLRAGELSPQLTEAHGAAAELLLRKGARKEATAAFARAFAASPDSVLGLLCGAKAFVAQGRPTEAEGVLRRLVAQEASGAPTGPGQRQQDIAWIARMMLGNILNETGRFDEAIACFERAIALAPGEAIAHHRLVTSRKVSEADRPWVARILSRLESPGLAANQGMLFHFAAGKALDDLGDHGGAMKHFDAANELRGKLHPRLDRAKVEQRIDRLIAHFTPELFAAHRDGASATDETPVLVLGLPRSGTTLIERIVSSHPEIAGGGELDFWEEQGPRWKDELPEVGARLRADYLALLRSIGPDARRVTDKMPYNFLWVGLVHLLLPGARVIHCRRNPIDTSLSLYTTYLNRTPEYATDRGDLVWYYRQYLRLMDHWRVVLPADRFLDVDYEDAIAAPEATARRLIAFCGLEWDPACLRPERNPDAVKTASSWQARQPIYRGSVERWRNYEPWLGELRGLSTREGENPQGAEERHDQSE